MRVSWHIPGVRKHRFARENRIVVEERKPRLEEGHKPVQ
jgi:hypothetical protein